ncbi:MAG: MBL fold metallo-hydrolase [Prevotella sp.]|nr:MBL fold metallo-hydrolase [Prevotella sp.]
MIHVQRFVCNMFQENTFVVSDETKDCIIVDCGVFYEEERRALITYIRDQQLNPRHLLATHGHVDHHFGDDFIYREFGLPVEVPAADQRLMEKLPRQAVMFLGDASDIQMPTQCIYLHENDVITFGNHTVSIIPTPGHSPGSVVYYLADERLALTGDTLFHLSIGRTDLEGGSMMQLIQSLRSLVQLPDDTIVLPGHGENTTIGEELKMNPFIDR